ncbi:hypothetical protein [Nocardia nepalensis]|uniref:hypothetical protein n=1 Tax=Nocardia nepalensis TaxID=3375448 RepID=UPI003B685153
MTDPIESATAAGDTPTTVAAGALVVGCRLDHGKQVRHVLDVGDGNRDIGFTDDSWWCDVPAAHPITLWDGQPSTRVYPFPFMATDERRIYRCQHGAPLRAR